MLRERPQFEAFVLALAKAMPIAEAAELLDEHDTRLWRILDHYVWEAIEKQDLSESLFESIYHAVALVGIGLMRASMPAMTATQARRAADMQIY